MQPFPIHVTSETSACCEAVRSISTQVSAPHVTLMAFFSLDRQKSGMDDLKLKYEAGCVDWHLRHCQLNIHIPVPCCLLSIVIAIVPILDPLDAAFLLDVAQAPTSICDGVHDQAAPHQVQ